jgi:hypothetical protein
VRLISLKISDFDDVQRFQVVRPNNVKALCVTVQGKCDPRPVTLMILCDDDNPGSAPFFTCSLYLYIEKAGIKKGYLLFVSRQVTPSWTLAVLTVSTILTLLIRVG